ncbi:MAG: protein kinase domain-containing protein [Nannocystales bacterium]
MSERDLEATTRGSPGTARLGRGVVDDRVEARTMLAHVSAALFGTPVARSVLGRYELQRRLGEGAFGVVYLGYDPQLDRRVALKVLRPGIELSQTVRMRFFREARALSSVQAAEVAAVFDAGTAVAPAELAREDGPDEVLYIVMELVDGCNLAEWLEAQARPWKEVVRVFVQAGRGLAAAHAAGIVHRDFKPSNVLIGHDGAVKVADFGLATVVDAAEGVARQTDTDPSVVDSFRDTGRTLTRTGTTLGTPPFMAPEQHQGRQAGPSADQFAFCASLYLALTGQQAFESTSLAGLLAKKHSGDRRPWPAACGAPRWVRSVVERGLNASQSDRFESMEALLSRLRTSPGERRRASSRWVLGPLALLGVGMAVYNRFEPGTIEVLASSDTGAALSGIEVVVDGQTESRTVRLSPGLHVVEVSAENHDPAARSVDVSPGSSAVLTFDLPRHRGTVDITASPGAARIYIDGVDHGSRVRETQLPTGLHVFDVRLAGHFAKRFRWSVTRGHSQQAHVGLTPVETWSHPAPDLVRHVRWLPDLDGDLRDEVLVDRAGTIRVLDPWRDQRLGEFSVAHGMEWETVVADADADGMPELFSFAVAEGGRRLASWSLSASTMGNERWGAELAGVAPVRDRLGVIHQQDIPAVVVALDGASVIGNRAEDGTPEWILPAGLDASMQALGSRVIVSDAEGIRCVLPSGTVAWGVEAAGRASVVDDVDGDGVSDVSSTDRAGSWTVRSGATGQSIVRFADPSLISIEPIVAGPALHGYLARSPDGAVLFGPTGHELQRFDGQSFNPVALDERAFVAVGRGEDTVLEPIDGRGPTRTLSAIAPKRLSVGDFNGDGIREWVAREHDGVLRFFDDDLEPLATLELDRSVNVVRSVRDADRDGAADLLMQNNSGVLLVKGPSRRWAVQSQAGVREAPSVVELDGEPYVVASMEHEGRRTLTRVRGRDGTVFRGLDRVRPDLHREAGLGGSDGAHLYFSAGQAVHRHTAADGSRTASFELKTAVYATPTVADVDGDGEDEVLIGTFSDEGAPRLVVLTAALDRAEREVPMSNFTWARALPADLDGDGDTEIVVFGLEGIVEAFAPNQNWTRLWRADVGARINYAGAVGGPASDRVIALTTMGGADAEDHLIFVRATDGEVLERHAGWGSRASTPLGFDGDSDGNLEVYAADAHGKIRRFQGDWSRPAWTRVVAASSDGPRATAPLVGGQLSTDGPRVVVVSSEGGALSIVHAVSGESLWRSSAGAQVEGHPQLADLDGDGAPELIVATHGGELISFRLKAATWAELSGAD